MPIYEGQNTEEAIQNGLKAMGVTQDEVRTTIIEEGKKGFLGVGKKNARVSLEPMVKKEAEPEAQTEDTTDEEPVGSKDGKISVETEPLEAKSFETEIDEKEPYKAIEEKESLDDQEALTQLGHYLSDIIKALGAPATVKTNREQGRIIFDLDTSKKGLLIGRHGKTLNALQYLAQVYVHRIARNKLPIVVNVGNYRQKRQDILQNLAQRTAEKVEHTDRPAFLEPMPAFERKQIHSVLSKNKNVATHSEGDEPYRYLVVEPAKKDL